MQYKIEIVERVTIVVHVDADSEEAALLELGRRAVMRNVETIDWQTMSTRVLEPLLDVPRPYQATAVTAMEVAS